MNSIELTRKRAESIRITEYYVYFLILCNLSVVKIIPFFTESVVHLLTFVSSVGLFGISLTRKKYIYYLKLISYLVLFIIVEIAYTFVKYHYSLLKMANMIYPFFYLLISPAIYQLLKDDNSFRFRLVRFIFIATTISVVMRIMVSWVWTATGRYIFGDMAFEFNDGTWVRNKRLRVIMPCFTFYYIPLMVYYYNLEQGIRPIKKIGCVLSTVIYAYYLFSILQARSFLLYNVLIFVFVLMIRRKMGLKKILIVGVLSVATVVFINTVYFEKIVYSLFNSGTTMGGSVFDRFATFLYFWKKFRTNPLFGIGFLPYTEKALSYAFGHITDIGSLGGIFRLGLLCGVLYIGYIFTWFQRFRKINSEFSEEKYFIISCVLAAILNGINTDFFYGAVIFSVPVISALIEDMYWNGNTEGGSADELAEENA